ncbi:MAG: hypothetical protein ABIL68_15705 [bacterium]
MNLRKAYQSGALFLVLFLCTESIFAQQSKFDLFLGGGIHIPKMDDINNIYLNRQDLKDYHKIRFTYDLSGGFMYRFVSNFSVKLGFNYLFHIQHPPVELISDDGETAEGKINYKIKAYCPFLGIDYHHSISPDYRFGFGFNLVRCMARLIDEVPNAAVIFSSLHGNSWGFVIASNIRRRLVNHVDIGLEFGYRFLEVNKVKVDSQYYEEFSEDVQYTINGRTLDLDFSGPFIRLLIISNL